MAARETTVGAMIEKLLDQKDALKFYANPDNWENGEIKDDNGDLARITLER